LAQDRQEGLRHRDRHLAEALDLATCYGWIDGQKGGFDENYWLQRCTPRKPRRQKATKLIEVGVVMNPAGLREVERARADGRWDSAYEPQSTATVPDDLRLERERTENAREFFASLDGANGYAILYRIQGAKKPETRARRIAKQVATLAEREKPYT
jgi:uncharacterized protein YdeI (YjbR/CyaY-like superfamily)